MDGVNVFENQREGVAAEGGEEPICDSRRIHRGNKLFTVEGSICVVSA